MANDIAPLFQQAVELHKSGKLQQAETLYRKVLDENPNYADAQHLLGMLQAQTENYDAAEKHIGLAITIDPKNALYHNNLGNLYRAIHKYELAETAYKKAINLKSDYAEAHNNLGALYHMQKRYDIALTHYAQATQLKPYYVEAHQNLGLLFMKTAEKESAIKQFNNVISLNPHHVNAHHQLANLYLDKNCLEDALIHYKKVLDYEPEHIETLNNLGAIMLKKNNPQYAIHYFTQVLAIDEKNRTARSNVASTFMLHNRYENALRHYDILIKQAPDDVDAHYNMGVAYMALGELHDALEHYNATILLDPRHAAAHTNLGAILLRIGKRKQAIEQYHRALELDSKNEVVRFLLQAIEGPHGPDQTPHEYVVNLFDNYAIQYDQHLVGRLHYTLPQQMRILYDKVKNKVGGIAILDIGCGTGLVGEAFVDSSSYLAGVDISQSMIEKARYKDFYDRLTVCDLHEYHSAREQGFDLITAAEVFSYIGNLDKTLEKCQELLGKSGLLIFSLEYTDVYPYLLQETARFAHSNRYIEELAQKYQFTIKHCQQITSRQQEEEAMIESLFALQKTNM